jgi:hypothetical protein
MIDHKNLLIGTPELNAHMFSFRTQGLDNVTGSNTVTTTREFSTARLRAASVTGERSVRAKKVVHPRASSISVAR